MRRAMNTWSRGSVVALMLGIGIASGLQPKSNMAQRNAVAPTDMIEQAVVVGGQGLNGTLACKLCWLAVRRLVFSAPGGAVIGGLICTAACSTHISPL